MVLLIVTLLQLLGIQCVIAQPDLSSANVFPPLIIDVTNPLNALVKKTLSEVDFVKTMNFISTLQTNNSKEFFPSLLYSTECAYLNFENCTTELEAISNILNSTLGSVDLTISITIDPSRAILFTTSYTGTKIQVPDFPKNILINLREDTRCSDLRKTKFDANGIKQNVEKWLSFNSNSSKKLGFGHTDVLSNCYKDTMAATVDSASFHVWNLRFGSTDGVTESFGLFKRRMDFLHKEHIKFVERRFAYSVTTPKPLVYYVEDESVGDESHRRLFLDFAETWTALHTQGKYKPIVVIQAPYFEQITSQDKFSAVARVDSMSCSASASKDAPFQGLMWYAPSALSTLSKYFDSLLLTLDQWRTLNSNEAQKLYGIPYQPASYLETNIILQLSSDIHTNAEEVGNDSCQRDWKSIENELEIQQFEPSKYAIPTTLVFEVSELTTGQFELAVDLNFIQRVSSNYTIGCWYDLMNTRFNPAPLVETCKSIGSSVYILRHVLWLEPPHVKSTNYLYYENEIRSQLGYVNRIRLRILKEHPEASVYLLLIVVSFEQTYINQKYPATVFCNAEVQNVNLYYEAILNWAKIKNFPIVLKSAFDGLNNPSVGSWMSLLRPLKSELGILRENSTDIPLLHPSFVLRNYPEGINKWDVDPCVEWNRFPPEITNDYFHNEYIGAILDFEDIQNGNITGSSFEIMLRFVLNRFHNAELLTGYDSRTVINALHNLNTQRLVYDSKSIFISYHTKESDLTCFEFVDEIEEKNLQIIKGIHLDLSNTSIENTNLTGFFNKCNNITKSGTHVGIVFQSTTCMDFIHSFLYDKETAVNNTVNVYLDTIDYIVCTDAVDASSLRDMSYLGGLFDSHLYIKRAYREFRPSLKVHFRVEINTELNSGKRSMEPYLLLLSRFREFGTAYEINYFLVNTFDSENGFKKNGWWGIQNFTLLNDPHTYVDKEAVFSNRDMWYPKDLSNVEVESRLREVAISH